mgnify:CR=1 FL=1
MTAKAVYDVVAKVWKDASEELRLARLVYILRIAMEYKDEGEEGLPSYKADSIANEYNDEYEEQFGYVSGDEVFDLLYGLGL